MAGACADSPERVYSSESISSSDDDHVVPPNPRGMTKVTNKKSYVWFAFSRLDLPQKNARCVMCSYVCTLCYERCRGPASSNAQFRECLLTVHNNNTSNMSSHLAAHHGDWVKQHELSKAETKQTIVAKTSQTASQKCMATFVAEGINIVLERVHGLAARLIVNKLLPLAVASADEFTKTLDAATYLKPESYKAITPGKLNKCLVHMFGEFDKFISGLIASTRALFTSNNDDTLVNGPPPGWLVVCHDGWDSLIKQFFGRVLDQSVHILPSQSCAWPGRRS